MKATITLTTALAALGVSASPIPQFSTTPSPQRRSASPLDPAVAATGSSGYGDTIDAKDAMNEPNQSGQSRMLKRSLQSGPAELSGLQDTNPSDPTKFGFTETFAREINDSGGELDPHGADR